MSQPRTLLLSGPAPPDAVAVWFGDLPLDATLECCYGPPNHRRAMGLWFPKLAADAQLQLIVGPAPAGPCLGMWRGTVLDWPGTVFMVGTPPKPKFPGCWVRPGQAGEFEAIFGLPDGAHPGIWFRGPRPRPGRVALTNRLPSPDDTNYTNEHQFVKIGGIRVYRRSMPQVGGRAEPDDTNCTNEHEFVRISAIRVYPGSVFNTRVLLPRKSKFLPG